MIKIEQLKLPFGHTAEELENAIEKRIGIRLPRLSIRSLEGDALSDWRTDISKASYNKAKKEEGYRILRRSLDCRKKPLIFYSYSIGIFLDKEKEERILKRKGGRRGLVRCEETAYKPPALRKKDACLKNDRAEDDYDLKAAKTCPYLSRPVIAGAGPAGLFCAYVLSLAGLRPIVLERGDPVDLRTRKVEAFFKGGELDPESNVQFGEGGAGTFSDGKLNSGIKDKEGRIAFVLESFVRFGAKDEIIYDAKPHLGTDALKDIIKNMRAFLTESGCEFRFGTKLCDIFIEDGDRVGGAAVSIREGSPLMPVREELLKTDILVLATGHSARDTLEMLCEKNITMEQKDFAMGLRVMHPQKLIDRAQYGEGLDASLPPADYKLSNITKDGSRVYSFCMCPGGYVVNSSSEQGRLCVNGMSLSDRGSDTANSAIVAAFSKEDFGSKHPLAGMWLQRDIEKKAFERAEGRIPVQSFEGFRRAVRDCNNDSKEQFSLPPLKGEMCIRGEYKETDLSGIYDRKIELAIIESMEAFDRTIHGFAGKEAMFAGTETRTSSPVRIVRDKDTLMADIKGLYPCGEGAGYAGGIMSAAVDGIKVAERIIESMGPGFGTDKGKAGSENERG